jgi:cation transport regulator ChaC
VFVFGYGSLVERADGVSCALRGFARRWGVAMDNTRDLPGYKFYVDRVTGERPAVFVAFLDLEESPGAEVEGIAFGVDEAALAVLDDRERNYARVEVTEQLSVDLGGPVWTYVGTTDARERFERSARDGTAVISREYLDSVPATEPDRLPVRELRRLPVPLSP